MSNSIIPTMTLNYWRQSATAINSFQINSPTRRCASAQQQQWRSDSPPVRLTVPKKAPIKDEWQTRRDSISVLFFCCVCQSAPRWMSSSTQNRCKKRKTICKLSRIVSKTSSPPPGLISVTLAPAPVLRFDKELVAQSVCWGRLVACVCVWGWGSYACCSSTFLITLDFHVHFHAAFLLYTHAWSRFTSAYQNSDTHISDLCFPPSLLLFSLSRSQYRKPLICLPHWHQRKENSKSCSIIHLTDYIDWII